MELLQTLGPALIAMAIVFGVYMTWAIGANDVGNAMATSVGSGALTVRKAVVIAAIFEFAGAFLGGGRVTSTIRKGIIDVQLVEGQPDVLVLGMISALLAGAIWLTVASIRGWPVSTTHSIVGGIIGFAVVGIGVDAVHWGTVLQIGASWVVSPFLGGVIAFVLMSSVRATIFNTDQPIDAARRWAPAYVFLVGFVISLVTMFRGLKHLDVELSIPSSVALAAAVGLVFAAVGAVLVARLDLEPSQDRDFQFASVERVFGPLMIFTACAMAFAHGSNDVANGVGPMAAVLAVVGSGGEVTQMSAMPNWLLALGGAGIVAGILTLGHRVMATLGTKITALTPTRGYCATLAAAATVALASRSGLPVSTTHVAVGAIMGVGMARGIQAMDLRVLGGMIGYWLTTLPAGAVLSAFVFLFLKGLLG